MTRAFHLLLATVAVTTAAMAPIVDPPTYLTPEAWSHRPRWEKNPVLVVPISSGGFECYQMKLFCPSEACFERFEHTMCPAALLKR